MSQAASNNDYRALLQQALVSLEQMQVKLRASEDAAHEPLAIIGMGFRFPGGANNASSFWDLLYNGRDAITEVPASRWNADQYFDPNPDAVGKMYTRWGGFIDHIDLFDPQFFGISPREAISMDPQQRLLLETTWEALENAGQASPPKLAGTQTGVFVGIVSGDYANLKMISGNVNEMDAYFGSGVSRSVAAGRIAYIFGLHGPTFAVDTACSSSLVAIHLASQSLRSKECNMAIAGGVNLILEPSGSISTSRAHMMSFSGRCKTFDATADGYVRSEGCGMVVLKRLSDAQADGDSILAVILGSALNQDGRSNGLTAPNGKAQEAVIRAALENARVKPGDVSYVETHGTGTSLGDPIEVRALGAVFNKSHSKEKPLLIGAVKTNVGHLEAAAGMAGLIKVILSLQNKTIPPHLHLKELNPLIPWNELHVSVPITATSWTLPEGAPLIAGLSSFGFSGTNSHLVIAQAPEPIVHAAKVERSSHLFTFSAKTSIALQDLAGKYETYLQQDHSVSIPDLAYSLNTGRSHFLHRLALTATSQDGLLTKLSAWRQGDASSVFVGPISDDNKPEVAFLFTGQGAQYAGMARQLYDSQPAFKKTMEQCDEILRPFMDRSLLSIIYPEINKDEQLINQTGYTQPALFAIEYSLAKLWQSWGVEPSIVIGHSVGEYVAACIADVFSLEDGLKLIAARGRLMQSLPSGGVMASIFADEKRVREAISPYENEVSIAAVNGPGAVVISGAESAVEVVVEALKRDGIKSRLLNVSHAFHSPLMEPILDEFEKVASSIPYHSPQIGIVSNVSGKLIIDNTISNASYWREHVRNTVRFSDGIRTLKLEGYHYFLENGPSPTLLGMARHCEPVDPKDIWLPSLRVGRSDWEQMLETLAQLYVHGQDVDWDAFERDYKAQRRRVELPTYPFQNERYWLDFDSPDQMLGTKTHHPLLGSRLPIAMPIFQKQLNAIDPAYLEDHRIHDLVLLPAAAYIEIALAAAKDALNFETITLEDITIHEPFPLTEDGCTGQIILAPNANGASFQYFSRESDNEQNAWRLHASGSIGGQTLESAPNIDLGELRARLSQPLSVDAYYQHLASVGANYGPAFRGVEEIWRKDGEAIGKVRLPASVDDDNYLIHPVLLDGCFHILGAAVPGITNLDSDQNNIVFVPIRIQRLQFHRATRNVVYCHVQLHTDGQTVSKTLKGDLTISDEDGRVIARLDGLLLQQVDRQTLQRAVRANLESWLYEISWQERPRAKSAVSYHEPGSWLIFANENETTKSLAANLRSKGETSHFVFPGNGFARIGSNEWSVDPLQADHFKLLLASLQENRLPLRGVIHLWSLGDSVNDRSALEELHSIHARNIASVLHLVQALAMQKAFTPRLWLVTRGVQTIANDQQSNVATSPLWGLGIVIASEQPNLNCVCIDLDSNSTALFDEVWSPDEEDQIALRGDRRYVARLLQSRPKSKILSEKHPVELIVKERGVLDNLTLQPMSRRPPQKGEVQIEVRATGLNFRDVLNALGMYPGDPGPLGGECSGIVTAVGEGVTEFNVGDAVIALAANSFSSYVTLSAGLTVSKPASLTFEEAATIPIAFLTAEYALNYLAKIKAGDKVLIHAATGGVGMAAVQIAQRAGATIFGTAGSLEKRKLLESYGVPYIMNSRTLDFADEIMSVTNGEGVDIVLNSLAGEFIPKSLSVLKETGSFIEIGKNDVWDQESVHSLRNGISYFILYLGEIVERDPVFVKQKLAGLLSDFEQGLLKPLPQQIFPIERSVDAFRFMAQAKHVGKTVITQNVSSGKKVTIQTNATYLISGGLGGLGLVHARALVDQGARHLALIGRSESSDFAKEKLREMEALGVEIFTAKADVARRTDVENVLSYIAEKMPPLRGVIHAAGVLDDGIILEQTWSRFVPVLAPKVDGAWNLHILTLGLSLDFFIMFSAGASLMGSAGQSNYAAANAFLDVLAYHRRLSGLPALSINWGPWAEVGMASRLGDQYHRRWSAQGMDLIMPEDGAQIFEQLLHYSAAQVAVLPGHWNKPQGQEINKQIRPLLSSLVEAKVDDDRYSPEEPSINFQQQLMDAAPEERHQLLVKHVTEEVIKVLGLNRLEFLNPRQGLSDLGMDSLMAVELSNRLRKNFDRSLPSTITFEYPTIEALTNYLASEVLGLQTTMSTDQSAPEQDIKKQTLIDEVEKIPDDQLEDELLKELKDAGY